MSDVNLGKQSILVEEKIDHEAWYKWNMNNGYVEGMEAAPEFNHDKMRSALDHLANIDLVDEADDSKQDPTLPRGFVGDLDAIEEGEEDNSEEDVDCSSNSSHSKNEVTAIKFSVSEVAQAFSHFSYLSTGRKRLICDLQGVFDKTSNTLKFTDPVVHYFNYRRQERENVHGRTDKGREGIAMFFATHKDCCGDLCRLVTGGFKKSRRYGKSSLKRVRRRSDAEDIICPELSRSTISSIRTQV